MRDGFDSPRLAHHDISLFYFINEGFHCRHRDTGNDRVRAVTSLVTMSGEKTTTGLHLQNRSRIYNHFVAGVTYQPGVFRRPRLEIAEGRIEEWVRSGGESLDLSGLRLEEVPASIRQLRDLKSLDLSDSGTRSGYEGDYRSVHGYCQEGRGWQSLLP